MSILLSHNLEFMTEATFGHGRSKRLQDYEEQIIALANNSIRPGQILRAIEGHQSSIITKDIYNLIRAHQLDELKGRSPLQAFYEDHLMLGHDSNGPFDFINT